MEAKKPDYKPPYVVPLSGFNALVRELYNGEANMINLYPQNAYEKDIVKVRRNRDLLINNPDLIKKLFANDEKVFLTPKLVRIYGKLHLKMPILLGIFV